MRAVGLALGVLCLLGLGAPATAMPLPFHQDRTITLPPPSTGADGQKTNVPTPGPNERCEGASQPNGTWVWRCFPLATAQLPAPAPAPIPRPQPAPQRQAPQQQDYEDPTPTPTVQPTTETTTSAAPSSTTSQVIAAPATKPPSLLRSAPETVAYLVTITGLVLIGAALLVTHFVWSHRSRARQQVAPQPVDPTRPDLHFLPEHLEG
ncbi:hypothetical protein D5S17_13330 [Pseudonocardiaceae bacterium YIM PH 21723]|nr:hypothetical protein D5S17_13330 [Pseudonocardiaceae bacterium YIM PH 21723]